MIFQRLIEALVLGIFLTATLGGCALVQDFEPEPVIQPPSVHVPQSSNAPKRELGSLWSEGSHWNDVYAVSSARVVGDLVIIRFDEAQKLSLKTRVDGLYKPEKEPEPEPESDADPKKTAMKKPPAPKNETFEAVFRGAIKEVHPRGVYTVVAANTVRIGNKEPYVYLEGQVRDRDIAADDTVSTSTMQGLRFDVYPTPPQQTAPGKQL